LGVQFIRPYNLVLRARTEIIGYAVVSVSRL